MYKTDNGLEVYETWDDLVNKGITLMWEYRENYYVRVETDDVYDDRVWIVDKKTGNVSWTVYADFFDIINDAKPIDPKAVKI